MFQTTNQKCQCLYLQSCISKLLPHMYIPGSSMKAKVVELPWKLRGWQAKKEHPFWKACRRMNKKGADTSSDAFYIRAACMDGTK